jgi:P4 family phage/plasmid primase-like protien
MSEAKTQESQATNGNGHRERLKEQARQWTNRPRPDGSEEWRPQEHFLSDKHRTELHHDSAIDPEVVKERGYETITKPTRDDHRSAELLARLRLPDWAIGTNGRYPGLLIPQYGPTGRRVSYQYKPPTPVVDDDGKTRKYASPKGMPAKVDVHPRNSRVQDGSILSRIQDSKVELWITEGVKKGDSLTSRGICAATLTGVWNWRNGLGSLGDWEEVAFKGRTVTMCFDPDARTKPQVLTAMIRCVQWVRSKGADTVYYLIVPEEVNGTAVKGVDDYFAAGGTLEHLQDHRTTTKPVVRQLRDTWSDARLAETIHTEVLADRFHWVSETGWQKWTGKVWADCTYVTVVEEVRKYSLARFAEAAAALAGGETDNGDVDGWHGMLSAGRERTVLNHARGLVEISITAMDADPDLINVQNGVVELETGNIHPHSADFLMTKIAGADYRNGHTHPAWDKALAAIPAEIRDWYQLRLGQAITGHMTPDDKLLVCQGGGENGKSTINITTGKAAGSYYLLASDRILLANPDQHPTELMDLKGVRYAVAEETPEARRLAVSRLKKTIGTPQITARKVHKDSVTFDATHSFFLSTNYRPMVDESDHGTWRRLGLVKFPYTFRKTQEEVITKMDKLGDSTLRDRCKSDPGVLAAALTWMVNGAIRWYEADRVFPATPDQVEADTFTWRKEADQVLCYIDDRLIFDYDFHIPTMDLLDDVNSWLKARGHRTWSDKTLAARFGDHDVVTTHGVTADRARKSEFTSRPDGPDPYDNGSHTFYFDEPKQRKLPERYRAWMGVRFRCSNDDVFKDGSDQGV